jgi:hypothetical protein
VNQRNYKTLAMHAHALTHTRYFYNLNIIISHPIVYKEGLGFLSVCAIASSHVSVTVNEARSYFASTVRTIQSHHNFVLAFVATFLFGRTFTTIRPEYLINMNHKFRNFVPCVQLPCLQKRPMLYSAFTDKVESNWHFPAPGRNCMTHRQGLQGFPDTSQVSLHTKNKITNLIIAVPAGS